jgi:hypothetical protein
VREREQSRVIIGRMLRDAEAAVRRSAQIVDKWERTLRDARVVVVHAQARTARAAERLQRLRNQRRRPDPRER